MSYCLPEYFGHVQGAIAVLTNIALVLEHARKHWADKKDKEPEKDGEEEPSKKQRLLSPIASPLADKKLTKKVLKTIKKAAGSKGIRRGVKEVVKAIKKKEKGLCIIAGDISPIEVIIFTRG